jgi:hypothetical protein
VTRLLRGRWLASAYKAGEQLVFCKGNGEGGDYRDAGKAIRAAVKAAGLHEEGRLSLHSLRHNAESRIIPSRSRAVKCPRRGREERGLIYAA